MNVVIFWNLRLSAEFYNKLCFLSQSSWTFFHCKMWLLCEIWVRISSLKHINYYSAMPGSIPLNYCFDQDHSAQSLSEG